MKVRGFAVLSLMLLAAATSPAAVRVELNGGYSHTSPYQYLDLKNKEFIKWVEFDNINFVNANLRASVDILNDDISFGILGGFLRRYDLYRAERSDTNAPVARTKIGTVYSFPILGYIEDRIGPFSMNVGCGVFLTNFSINDPGDTVGMLNQGIFGFLFGGGYTFAVTKNISIPVRADLMVNVPTVLFDMLPGAVRRTYADSRDNDTYQYSKEQVFYNANITVGVGYRMLEGLKIFQVKWFR